MFWTIAGIICLIIASVAGIMGIKILLASIILVVSFTILGAITDSNLFLFLVQALLAAVVFGITAIILIAIFKNDE